MEGDSKKINWWNGLLALICLGGIIYCLSLVKSCSADRNEALRHCTVTGSDTVIKEVYHTKMSDPIVHTKFIEGKTVYVDVPANVDTQAILKNYFAIHIGVDTLRDKDLLGLYYYTISENKLKKDSFIYRILRPDRETIITNTVIPEKKIGFYLGFNTGASIKGTGIGFGPEALITTKKWQAIGAGYDVLNKTASIKFLIKL